MSVTTVITVFKYFEFVYCISLKRIVLAVIFPCYYVSLQRLDVFTRMCTLPHPLNQTPSPT